MKSYFPAVFLALFVISLACPVEAIETENELGISKAYALDIASKMDKLVKENFFDRSIVKDSWKRSYKENHERIAKCRSLIELSGVLNSCLKELKTSHCRFLTINDETYHFLHSLFGSFRADYEKRKDLTRIYTGFVTGGDRLSADQVRYVLDGSPAKKAGISYGDRILKVDGAPYLGYSNFLQKGANSKFTVEFEHIAQERKDRKSIVFVPKRLPIYSGYAEATESSARVFKRKGKNIGYIHLWSGGGLCHEALEEALTSKLAETDALILDLRDGYGGNSLDDLDRFYRSPQAYPDFVSKGRDGKEQRFRYYYDKPMVALINGGARSGKELLAYSLKKTGRAYLIGEKTSGAVVAGRLFRIDHKTSLYLAIQNVFIGGKRLEGQGVEPDLKLDLDTAGLRQGKDNQLEAALERLAGESS